MSKESPLPGGHSYETPFQAKNGDIDPMLLGSVGVLFVALFFIIWRLLKLKWDEEAAQKRVEAMRAMMEQDQREQHSAANVAGGRRRNVRRRVNHDDEDGDFLDHMMQQSTENEHFEEDGTFYPGEESNGKIGKKKAAKIAAKEEKKAMREYEMREREERKQREAEKERRRELERENERLAEQAEEDRIRKEKEERERKDEEEYQKMKSSFAVEEEGFDEVEGEEAENLLKNFVDYIKNTKVVSIEELAAQFRLKSTQALERINQLLENGDLQGVMDDRGKFICITEDELQAVAKFINQRGRVRIAELVEQSNKLIRLEAEC